MKKEAFENKIKNLDDQIAKNTQSDENKFKVSIKNITKTPFNVYSLQYIQATEGTTDKVAREHFYRKNSERGIKLSLLFF
jgi:hypothetical protein